MDVTLIYKWDYEADDAYIASDGSFRLKRGKLAPSDDDAAAIASARAVAVATGGNMVGVTIGNGDAGWAAARGAGDLVMCEAYAPVADDVATAERLRAVLEAAPATDLVVMADAIEHAGVAPALAAMLDLPCVLGVRDFEIDPDNSAYLRAHRSVDAGMETLRFKAPALISVSALTSEKDVPTMKEMLAARKAPRQQVEERSVSESTVVVQGIAKAELKPARRFEGDPDQAAQELVAALRAGEVL